jgi:hypothetical protein
MWSSEAGFDQVLEYKVVDAEQFMFQNNCQDFLKLVALGDQIVPSRHLIHF